MARSAKDQLEILKKKHYDVIRNLQHEKSKMQDIIDDQGKVIAEKNQKLSLYEKQDVLVSNDYDIKKKILTFRARQYNVIEIRDKLIQLGIDYDVEKINTLVTTIDLLNNELILHYENEKIAFEEQIKINKNIQKEALLRDNQFLIDKARIMIDKAEKLDDSKTLGIYMDKYDKYINTRTKLLGDVVLEKEEEEIMNIVNEMADDYEEQKNKIIKFTLNNVRTI